jgi:flavorubredoxin
MAEPYTAADQTWVIPLTLPAGGNRVLPLRPLLIRGEQPLLADTGPAVLRREMLDALFSLLDPGDLRWVWLSHDDGDHAGALQEILGLCPQARLVTSPQGLMRLAKTWAPEGRRVVLLGEGASLDIGDRRVTSLRPPLFDDPATRGLLDGRTGLYYAVDCFAAMLDKATIGARDARDVPEADYAAGFQWLNRANAPWYALTDPARFGRKVAEVRQLDPAVIASYHGPAVRGAAGRLCDMLEAMPRDAGVEFPGRADLMRTLADAR